MKSALSDRQALWAFVVGCLAVTASVGAHLPMFAMARGMHYHLVGMPMTSLMIGGMGLILSGLGVAAYGLLPRNLSAHRQSAAHIVISAPEDAPLGVSHFALMLVLVIALIVDVMKPAARLISRCRV
jgi:putative MFS transporter